jgi:hypothetical protein
MSVEDEVIKAAVTVVLTAALEELRETFGESEKYQASLDELAERAAFEAAGNRKLQLRKKGGT